MITARLSDKERIKLEKKNYKTLVKNKTCFNDSKNKVMKNILSSGIPRFGGLIINKISVKSNK